MAEVTKEEAYEVAKAAAMAGHPLLALKLAGWLITHPHRATHAELRTRLNAIRAELGKPPL